MSIFLSADFGVLVRDMKMTLRINFDQWPKIYLGLDVQPEIPILKGLYSIATAIVDGSTMKDLKSKLVNTLYKICKLK
jgi:hypothetical protein